MRAGLTVVLGSLLASTACGKIAGFEDFHVECRENQDCRSMGGASGGASSGGKAANGGSSVAGGLNGSGGRGFTAMDSGDVNGCRTGGRGPAMALVPRPNSSAFWMDRTEVTVGQYEAFLKDPEALHDALACPNAPTGPAPGCGPSDAGVDPELPRTCVDWCDARAFCIWAHKELCQDVPDPGPGLLDASDFYVACTEGKGTSGQEHQYGCGSSCRAGTCNGESAGRHEAVHVGTTTHCFVTVSSPACTIADLSGNVEEWTQGCHFESGSSCAVRGGSFASSDSELRCDALMDYPRTTKSPGLGFRCCDTAPP